MNKIRMKKAVSAALIITMCGSIMPVSSAFAAEPTNTQQQTQNQEEYTVTVENGKAAILTNYTTLSPWSSTLNAKPGDVIVFSVDQTPEGMICDDWVIDNGGSTPLQKYILHTYSGETYHAFTMKTENVRATPVLKTVIKEASVTLSEPVAGKHPNHTVRVKEGQENQYEAMIRWRDITNRKNPSYLGENSTFRKGHTYRVDIGIMPKSDYVMSKTGTAEPEKSVVNGELITDRENLGTVTDYMPDLEGISHRHMWAYSKTYTIPGETDHQATISFDANGGTGTMESVTVNDESKYELPACTFDAPELLEFDGWEIETRNMAEKPGAQIDVYNDLTLVAKWKIKSSDKRTRIEKIVGSYHKDRIRYGVKSTSEKGQAVTDIGLSLLLNGNYPTGFSAWYYEKWDPSKGAWEKDLNPYLGEGTYRIATYIMLQKTEKDEYILDNTTSVVVNDEEWKHTGNVQYSKEFDGYALPVVSKNIQITKPEGLQRTMSTENCEITRLEVNSQGQFEPAEWQSSLTATVGQPIALRGEKKPGYKIMFHNKDMEHVALVTNRTTINGEICYVTEMYPNNLTVIPKWRPVLEEIAIEMTEPVAGEHPKTDINLTEKDKYVFLENPEWVDKDFHPLDETATFETGKTYLLIMNVKTPGNKEWGEDITLLVNGTRKTDAYLAPDHKHLLMVLPFKVSKEEDNVVPDQPSSGGGGGGYIPTIPECNATVTAPDKGIEVSANALDSSIVTNVKQYLKNSTDTRMVGGSENGVEVVVKKDGTPIQNMKEPVVVSIPVSNNDLKGVKDPSRLTLAQVVKDSKGNLSLEYIGGTYDPKTGTFTAKADNAGNYVLIERDTLTKLVLTINDKTILLNDKAYPKDVAPIIEKSRTMVPLRYIGEALGCKVDWSDQTRSITITRGDTVLTMTVDKTIPGFDATPIIRDNRTLVPIRYVSEALGANVIYSPMNHQVIIVQ